MTTALKIAKSAVLAAMFVSTAAFAQTGSHETITVTPKQENVWGAVFTAPSQEQAYVTKNVFGARFEVPASQISAQVAAAR